MKLIVGLGNPGKEYQRTRHNMGFLVLDALRELIAEAYDASPWELSKKFNAEVSGCSIRGEKIVLAKPMTYMNDSGIAVQLLAHFYRLTRRDLLVVHDDKDLPLGIVKLQDNRGDAGHNGVRSVIEHIGDKDFERLRVGIAQSDPKKMKETSAFVLGKFGVFERKKADAAITAAAERILRVLEADQETAV